MFRYLLVAAFLYGLRLLGAGFLRMVFLALAIHFGSRGDFPAFFLGRRHQGSAGVGSQA
ncbi:hypothetical protein [Herbaspirillum sp.]|uniref:hypothetical protein n=1 Tax=Herbaspirillum sp. TaxID=1890675 RepID=UPI0031D8F6B9